MLDRQAKPALVGGWQRRVQAHQDTAIGGNVVANDQRRIGAFPTVRKGFLCGTPPFLGQAQGRQDAFSTSIRQPLNRDRPVIRVLSCYDHIILSAERLAVRSIGPTKHGC